MGIKNECVLSTDGILYIHKHKIREHSNKSIMKRELQDQRLLRKA